MCVCVCGVFENVYVRVCVSVCVSTYTHANVCMWVCNPPFYTYY